MAATNSSTTAIGRRMEGKTVIMTGAASGIGEATARLFSKHGAIVIITDIQDDLGHALVKEITESDPTQTVTYMHCDVTKEEDVKKVVDNTMEKYGKLDVMFSNVGITGEHDLSITMSDYDNYRKVFDTNWLGSMYCAKHASRVMVPVKRGNILFSASCCSVVHGAVPHTYTASKHAVVGLTKNLGVELGKYSIRVNCISAFGVPTKLLTTGYGGVTPEQSLEMVEVMANLKGVMLKAEDVADAALYLASDESRYVSGHNLVVDGGYSTTNASFGMWLKDLYPY